jgi:hypothetical protein
MDFTDFVVHAGVKQNALSRCGFTSVDMRRNTNVAVALNRGMASHVESFVDLNLHNAALHNVAQPAALSPSTIPATAPRVQPGNMSPGKGCDSSGS